MNARGSLWLVLMAGAGCSVAPQGNLLLPAISDGSGKADGLGARQLNPIIGNEVRPTPDANGEVNYPGTSEVLDANSTSMTFRADMIVTQGGCTTGQDACVYSATPVGWWPTDVRFLLYTRTVGDPAATWQSYLFGGSPTLSSDRCGQHSMLKHVQVMASDVSVDFTDENGQDCGMLFIGTTPDTQIEYGMMIYPVQDLLESLGGNYQYLANQARVIPPVHLP